MPCACNKRKRKPLTASIQASSTEKTQSQKNAEKNASM